MSEEFIKVATKEINDELSAISNLLASCTTDHDLLKKAAEIEGHLHKIKGLAPMMGQKEIGEISALNDSLFKFLAEGKPLEGIFNILRESTVFMQNAMDGNIGNINELKQKIETKYSKILGRAPS